MSERFQYQRMARWLATVVLVTGVAGLVYVPADTQPVTVYWNDVHQEIDGFGASSADFAKALTPVQADFFFSRNGIGLSILRTQIIPDTATCDAEFKKGACSNSNGQILNGELGTAQLAVARGATVFSSPWSPPGAFKSNSSFKNGGTLLPSHYADWAAQIASYVTMMAKNGVPLYAVSVQNEPDLSTNYGSCKYTGNEIHAFVPYLYTALNSAGVGATKIMIAEQAHWEIDLTIPSMTDPKVMPEIGIIAAHSYNSAPQAYSTGRARLWQTEDSSQSQTYDGSMDDGLTWALKIHSYFVHAGINAWVWWFLTDMPQQGEGMDNAALTDFRGNIPKRTYTTGQFSRFVHPGWFRIGTGDLGLVKVAAFKDAKSQDFAIVVINPTHKPVDQTFALIGFSTNTVTPWITSIHLSLEPEQPVQVNGTSFTYKLRPSSVTTFSGTATAAR
jgi:glucuronoarabinoxylan endo-1,4-beta-xylanase